MSSKEHVKGKYGHTHRKYHQPGSLSYHLENSFFLVAHFHRHQGQIDAALVDRRRFDGDKAELFVERPGIQGRDQFDGPGAIPAGHFESVQEDRPARSAPDKVRIDEDGHDLARHGVAEAGGRGVDFGHVHLASSDAVEIAFGSAAVEPGLDLLPGVVGAAQSVDRASVDLLHEVDVVRGCRSDMYGHTSSQRKNNGFVQGETPSWRQEERKKNRSGVTRPAFSTYPFLVPEFGT